MHTLVPGATTGIAPARSFTTRSWSFHDRSLRRARTKAKMEAMMKGDAWRGAASAVRTPIRERGGERSDERGKRECQLAPFEDFSSSRGSDFEPQKRARARRLGEDDRRDDRRDVEWDVVLVHAAAMPPSRVDRVPNVSPRAPPNSTGGAPNIGVGARFERKDSVSFQGRRGVIIIEQGRRHPGQLEPRRRALRHA